jgi:outer membrane protein
MKELLLILLLITVYITAYSEIRTVTLSNAVQLAYQNNPQIRQMESEAAIAEAQSGQSVADFWMPDVNITGAYNIIDEASVTNSYIPGFSVVSNVQLTPAVRLPVLSPRTVTNVYSDNYSVTLGVSKPLFAGFRLWDSMELKKKNLNIAKMKLEDKKKEISASVSVSFYNLFLIKENLEMNEALIAHTKNRLDETTAKFRGGVLSEYDKIRSEVQYENSLPVLDKQRDAFTNLKQSLCTTIGISDPDTAEFSGTLFDATNGAEDLEAPQALVLALSNNMGLKAMDEALEVLRLAHKVADETKYPALVGYFNDSLTYKKANAFNDTDRSWVNGWNLGLQLTIPVDDWVPVSKTAQQASEADANVDKGVWNRRQLEDGITLQVRTMLVQMNEAKRVIQRQAGTYQKAKRAYDLCEDRYHQGTSTTMELTDVEMVAVQTRSTYLQAVYDYGTAWINLKRLIGE